MAALTLSGFLLVALIARSLSKRGPRLPTIRESAKTPRMILSYHVVRAMQAQRENGR